MRKIILITFCCLGISTIYSQGKDDIYRIENKSESPAFATYNVNVLILHNDGTYEIMYQQYQTKKMMKKNIILNLDKEYGKWERKVNKLYLKDSKSENITKFFIKSKNKIALIIEDLDVSSLNWKKI